MTLPGLELFISSEKAVEGAAKFRSAVESAADAVERIGTVVDKLDGALAKLGTTSRDAADPMAKVAKGAAAADAGLKQGAAGAAEFSKQMANARAAAVNAAAAQGVLANSGRGTAGALKLLGATDTARQFDFLATALGNAGASMRGFSALAGATPLGAVTTLATGAVLAFASLSEGVERTGDKFKKLAEASEDARSFGRALDELRLAFRTGDRDAGNSFIAKLREELVALNDLSRTGQREIPAERVLAAIEQRAPETIGALRRVMAQMRELGEEGRDVPLELSKQFGELATIVSNRFGVDVQIVGDKLGDLSDRAIGNTRSVVKGFTTELPLAVRAVGIAFDVATGKANATQETIAKASAALRELQSGNIGTSERNPAAGEQARADALQEFLRGKLQEAELLGKEEEQAKRLQFLQEASNALLKSKRPILEEELALVLGIAAVRTKFATEEAEKKRAESVGDVIAKLERENALLEQQGSARQALQRQQDVEAQLAKIKLGANEDERKLLDDLLARNRELLAIEEQRNQADRTPKLDRTREYLRALEQEAELLNRSGEERERYRIQLEVENDVREQGLKLTKEEIDALVQKKQSLREVSEAQAQASQLGREVGNALGNALEGFILDGKKARDVLKDLFNDLARIAFRRTVTNNLENLFSSAIGAIGGAVAGGGVPAGVPVGVPRMTGGLIPAMVGAVIDTPTILQRGGSAYSVAEGGKTTPEAIFRLARDERGNLGVAAVGGGGGGDTINMSFPSVRNATDAKAMRATIGQQMRALRAGDKRGRRGRRPTGE